MYGIIFYYVFYFQCSRFLFLINNNGIFEFRSLSSSLIQWISEGCTCKKKTSTPNISRVELTSAACQSPNLSVILLEKASSVPTLISDDSISKLEEHHKQCIRNLPKPGCSSDPFHIYIECSNQTSFCEEAKKKRLEKKFLECSSQTSCCGMTKKERPDQTFSLESSNQTPCCDMAKKKKQEKKILECSSQTSCCSVTKKERPDTTFLLESFNQTSCCDMAKKKKQDKKFMECFSQTSCCDITKKEKLDKTFCLESSNQTSCCDVTRKMLRKKLPECTSLTPMSCACRVVEKSVRIQVPDDGAGAELCFENKPGCSSDARVNSECDVKEEATSMPAPIQMLGKLKDSLLKKCGLTIPDCKSLDTTENQFQDCSGLKSHDMTTKGLVKRYLESTNTPGKCSCRFVGKSVRIQVPEVDDDEELFQKPSCSRDARGVCPARAHEAPSTKPCGSKPKVKSECVAVKKEPPESICRSSDAVSPTSSCASMRADYYHNKLLATLQILHNKEETVRIQAESLSVAEARIESLTANSDKLKREIERRGRELKTLRETIQASRTEKCDASAQIQEIDNQKNIVTTLQNNLGVIEELYRECFYETAKQDGLIDMLRKSYLDVRLMDKEKSDQITRLHNVINTQKWSLDQCQDIASDVENLKVEISNFLNSSNNDSGVWEESLAGGLTDDLQDIAGQLLRLMELLTGDCTCGLKEENRKLRKHNEALKVQVDDLQQKNSDYESIVKNKDNAHKQCQQQLRAKECELHSIRQQLAEADANFRDRGQSCETMKQRLQQTQQLLNDKTQELARLRSQVEHDEETIAQLREELDQSRDISKELCTLRGSACAAQRRARELRAELNKALEHAAHVEALHRSEVERLERSLSSAQARGAALCAETQRAACSVRSWTRHMKDINREQEDLLKQKESKIRLLELRLQQGQNDTTLTRASENDTCTQCTSARSLKFCDNRNNSFDRHTRVSNEEASCSKCLEGSLTCSPKVRVRRQCALETSGSKRCTSTPLPPQRRLTLEGFRSKRLCGKRVCVAKRDVSVQRPERCEVNTCTSASGSDHEPPAPTPCHAHDDTPCQVGRARLEHIPREVCGGSVEDVLSRVETAGAALADSMRRWNRRDHLPHSTH